MTAQSVSEHELHANGANFTNGEYNSTLKQEAGRGKERNDIYSAVLGLNSAWGKKEEDCELLQQLGKSHLSVNTVAL